MDKPYRILSLDGGGIRGLVPALILASLEAETGKRITDLFDLVVGTSTGGILALALTGDNPPTAEKLVGLYEKEGGKIFDRSFCRRLPGHALLDEKYSGKGLIEVLKEYLGKNSLLSDATTDVLVTSYALERRMPFLFKSTKAKDPATKKTHDFKLWEVGRATLSANVRETRSTQRIRVGRRQRKRTCWDCEREWKRMVVPLEPGRPSEARQLLRTQR